MKFRSITFFLLLVLSQYAYAAQATPWKVYLGGVVMAALLISVVLSLKNKKADSVKAKILLTGLYFWPITFAGMMILALFYHFR